MRKPVQKLLCRRYRIRRSEDTSVHTAPSLRAEGDVLPGDHTKRTRLPATLAILLVVMLFFSACRETSAGASQVQVISGQTMGTYYKVSYVGQEQEGLQAEVDSLLAAINKEVSTYDPGSLISRFNTAGRGISLAGSVHFLPNLETAQKVYAETQGAFDATVMPLVNFWGFGYTPERQHSRVDTAAVDSLLQWVGMSHVRLAGDSLLKDRPEVQLDFSACAKGYAVDEVARLLSRKGLNDHLVDIGGEGRALGHKPGGAYWRIGINAPREDAALDDIIAAVRLENRSVATSGNYRNWYEAEGVKYSHTINPKNGFPERTTLLSASVFHKNCMLADAYATSCMVLGVEKALSLAASDPEMDVYLVFSRPDGTMETRYTSGLNGLFDE